jgi:hypothetical protein
MTSLETLYMKNAVNEHSFAPVTHTTYSDIRFGRYGFLKTEQGAELILDRTVRWVNLSGLRSKKRQSWRGLIIDLAASLLSFSTTI